ncbi:MAG: chromate efflux transporter [Rhodobacterales bacterium]|nr:chromate efflux transporter [Rhodobacterales bacterium]
MSSSRTPPSAAELGWIFFKIGCVAFGGFMALISVVEEVVVRDKGWLEREDMLDGISLANVLPGPQAVNTVTYVGYRVGGLSGAMASFIGILTPTFVLVTLLTFLYFGVAQDLPMLEAFFAGIVPAVSAVIVGGVWRLGKKAITGWVPGLMCGLAFALPWLVAADAKVMSNLFLLAVAASLGAFLLAPDEDLGSPSGTLDLKRLVPVVLLPLGLAAVYLAQPPLPEDGLAELAVTFSGLSVMLFGGGYVFIPMIMDVVVSQQGWLTPTEFNDGIAFSQITPGPIMISAAFIGQRVMMVHGAVWAVIGGAVGTLAIFAPPAMLMVAATQILDQIRSSRRVQGALRGVRGAVVGMIAAAAVLILATVVPPWELSGQWTVDALPVFAIFGAALVALVRFKVSVLMVLPAAGALGLLVSWALGAY